MAQEMSIKQSIMHWFCSITSVDMVHMALSFGLCFCAGMIFKRYMNYIFVSLVVSGVILAGLVYADLAVVYVGSIKIFLGLQQVNTIHDLYEFGSCLICVHHKTVIAGIIGFVIGCKI